ncbi:MAG: trypsin-like serine protease with C-terminal PDZ domain [Parcubacteria group bacterium Gr01-1014_70]|nr:MAG: trypsin-like serine protease with C-terminal PDZ domain [Parcubacteria group bacterium Gr01-1014_70]
MDELTKTQLVLLVLLVSFITSLTTVVVTVSVLDEVQSDMPQTVLERVIHRVSSERGNEVIVIKEEDLIVEAVESVSPAVVSIIAAKDLPIVERFFIDPFGSEDYFREFFEFSPTPPLSGETERREIGRGTGFLVSEDGYIITNKHVVADEDAEYTVILNTGSTFTATVLARDPVQDIAVVKIEDGSFPTAPLGSSDNLKVGQTVVAIGNALGQFSNTVSVGVISGTERTLTANGMGGQSDLQHVLQTDAAINPGNSGGPLLDLKGNVIGINTAMVSGAENIGFAIPVDVAVRDLEQVRRLGRIVYPFLGVRYVVITEELRKEKNVNAEFGVLLIKYNASYFAPSELRRMLKNYIR